MTSRLSGFHRESLAARRQLLASLLDLQPADLAALDGGGLTAEAADRLIENAVGLFGLPFGLGVNLQVNGRDVLIPMVTEEASVIAGLSNGARLARAGGGVTAEADPPLMLGQIQVLDVPDGAVALAALEQHRDEIMAAADRPHRSIVALGGGARRLEARTVASPVGEMLIVGLQMDVRDAMGANTVNTSLEAIAPLIARGHRRARGACASCRNLADRRLARAAAVPLDALAFDELPGDAVAQRHRRGLRLCAGGPLSRDHAQQGHYERHRRGGDRHRQRLAGHRGRRPRLCGALGRIPRSPPGTSRSTCWSVAGAADGGGHRRRRHPAASAGRAEPAPDRGKERRRAGPGDGRRRPGAEPGRAARPGDGRHSARPHAAASRHVQSATPC